MYDAAGQKHEHRELTQLTQITARSADEFQRRGLIASNCRGLALISQLATASRARVAPFSCHFDAQHAQTLRGTGKSGGVVS